LFEHLFEKPVSTFSDHAAFILRLITCPDRIG